MPTVEIITTAPKIAFDTSDGTFQITGLKGRIADKRNRGIRDLVDVVGEVLLSCTWTSEQIELTFPDEPAPEETAAAVDEVRKRKRAPKAATAEPHPGSDLYGEATPTPGQLVACDILNKGHNAEAGCENARLLIEADTIMAAAASDWPVTGTGLVTCKHIPLPHLRSDTCPEATAWGAPELDAANREHAFALTQYAEGKASGQVFEKEQSFTEPGNAVWYCHNCKAVISEEQARGEGEAHVCAQEPPEKLPTAKQRSKTAAAMAKAAQETAEAVTLTPSTNGHAKADECAACPHPRSAHNKGGACSCGCPSFFETPIETGLKVSDPVEVKVGESPETWRSAIIIGFRSGGEGEDFKRIDVQFDDGREVKGCHPECIRPAVAEREPVHV